MIDKNSNIKNDGGLVFPANRTEKVFDKTGDANWISVEYSGISVRDYFAAHALMGILNNAESRIAPMRHQMDRSNAEILAENCYYMADALIAQREKPK